MSEPALRQLGTGDLDEFRRTGQALIDAVADHLEALRGLGAQGTPVDRACSEGGLEPRCC